MSNVRVHIAVGEATNFYLNHLFGNAIIVVIATIPLIAMNYWGFSLATIVISGCLLGTLLITHAVYDSGRQHELRLSYIEQSVESIGVLLEEIQTQRT